MFSLRDKQLAKDIVLKIKKLDVKLKFMHVCGTHQDTLVKHGLDALLRECGIEIGHGCLVRQSRKNFHVAWRSQPEIAAALSAGPDRHIRQFQSHRSPSGL